MIAEDVPTRPRTHDDPRRKTAGRSNVRVHAQLAVSVERSHQILRDRIRRTSLDLMALEHEYEPALLQQSNARRARRIARDVPPRHRRPLALLSTSPRSV